MIAPPRATIADIVKRALLVDPALDREFEQTGTVTINGQPVPREFWSHARARRLPGQRICVVLHPYIGKGGGDVVGNIIKIAALIAAVVIAGPIGVAAFGATTASFIALGVPAAGPLAAQVLPMREL